MPWLKGKVNPGFGNLKVTARGPQDLKPVVDAVGRILADHGVQDEPLGLDGSTMELFYADAFRKAGINIVHAKSTLDGARIIKTRDEIELMRITCANSEKAFADIMDVIRPGVRECDLVATGIKTLYELGVDHTEDLVCCSGYNTNPFSWSFTDKPLRPGDLIYIDVDGAAYQGYVSCVYRTFCCGRATSEQKELYEEGRSMLYAGMNTVKDGSSTLDIVEQWPDSPAYWGYKTWAEVGSYAVGHGLGLSLHEPPYIRPALARERPAKLKEGMVFALETWVGKKGGKDGVRLEEDILVTKDGYEVLTRFPIDELIECWV
ncbi:MAG: aminopeptidase P family protein [Deltaproteobacteria bacterium]|nr:aminopeptidase P family protein [Deltaproteobacteria bacterium]